MRYLTHILLSSSPSTHSSSSTASPLHTRPLRDSFGLDAIPCWCVILHFLPSAHPADSVVFPAARRLADAFRTVQMASSTSTRAIWADGAVEEIEMRDLRVRRPERAWVVRGRTGEGMEELEDASDE